jgi:hypothetical protein
MIPRREQSFGSRHAEPARLANRRNFREMPEMSSAVLARVLGAL